MKQLVLLALLLLLPLNMSVSAQRRAPRRPAFPEVSLELADVFDMVCAERTKQPIDPAAVKELGTRLDSFRQHWRAEAPRLLGAVPTVTGVPFRRRELWAALFLCHLPSMNTPLMISVRHYLTGAPNGPAPLSIFSNTVFHEVLHIYVGDIVDSLPGQTTPLIEKYKSEHPAVLSHLHLYAIEALVYRRLGRENELEAVFAFERRFPRPALAAKAREIVAAEM